LSQVVIRALALLLLGSLAVGSSAQAQPTAGADEHDKQARAYFRTESYERAAEEFRRAYELDKNPARLFNVGLAFEKAGDRSKASAAYAEYLQVAPQGDKAAEARARKEALDRQEADEGKAQDEARKKAEADAAARVLAELAQSHVQAGKHVEAAATYQAAYNKNHDDKYLFERAEALRLGDKTDEAIAAYRDYRAKAPSGLYEGQARHRQTELEEQVSAENMQNLSSSLQASRKPRELDGRGLRITGYVGGSVALAAAGTAFFIRRKWSDLDAKIRANGDIEDVADPASYDTAFAVSLSASLQGLAIGGLCYTLGAGDKRDSSGAKVGSCLLGGIGVGALAMAAYSGLQSKSLADELHDRDFADGKWTNPDENLIDRGRGYEAVAIGHLILGVGGVVAGGLLYYFSGDSSDGRESLSIVPAVDGGEVGLTGVLQF
jgi:tetratricopeptide (TPR) repeat protein